MSYIIQNLVSSRLQTGGRQRVCVLLGEHQQGQHLIVTSRQTGASQHKTWWVQRALSPLRSTTCQCTNETFFKHSFMIIHFYTIFNSDQGKFNYLQLLLSCKILTPNAYLIGCYTSFLRCKKTRIKLTLILFVINFHAFSLSVPNFPLCFLWCTRLSLVCFVNCILSLFIYLYIQAGRRLQKTLPGTWRCHWHTDPLRAAEKTSCWQAWQRREITLNARKKCTKTLQQYAIFSKFILGYNMQHWAW